MMVFNKPTKRKVYSILTALIPHTTVVFPSLNIVELSAWTIEPILILIGRKDKKSLPSGRIFWA